MPKQRTSKPTFQSYIGNNGTLGKGRASDDEARNEPQLLPGETLIMSTEHVSRFTPYSEFRQGIFGTLYITNFKVSFHSADHSANDPNYGMQRNKLFSEDDIVLNTVDAVYQVSKGRRKKLLPGSISDHVKKMEIHTKDFRVHNFSFKHSPKQEAKRMVNAIIHHAFPTRLELLFAFEYRTEHVQDVPDDVEGFPEDSPRYNLESDWLAEMKRQNVPLYKTNLCNSNYRLSASLPEVFVIPQAMDNADIATAVQQFSDYRCPFWCYTHRGQASLVSMPYLVPEAPQQSLEDKMIGKITLSHPKCRPPTVYDLSRHLPSMRDIHTSYEKLRELCMPGLLKDVHNTDSSWLSGLEGTHWLRHVGSCVGLAQRIAYRMNVDSSSVIIKEVDCRDLVPLTSSLVQLLLDPHFRTISGFQSLVEREWVAMGHRFADRLGLVPTADSQQSPVFLLFLDCVWQLQKQFPTAFQFSEVYLTTLWDTVCLGLFHNFLFNSAHERSLAASKVTSYTSRQTAPRFQSAWDWSHQFTDDDLSLFKNPLYLIRTEFDLENNSRSSNASDSRNYSGLSRAYARKLTQVYQSEPVPELHVLSPVSDAAVLQFWSHCYLRWLTPVQIMAGGSPSEYLQQCILAEEIICLEHKIRNLEAATPIRRTSRPKSKLIFSFNAQEIPSKKWTNNLTSSFPFTPLGSMKHTSFFGTPLSMYLETSMLQESDTESTDELQQSEVVDSGDAVGVHFAGAEVAASPEQARRSPGQAKDTTPDS